MGSESKSREGRNVLGVLTDIRRDQDGGRRGEGWDPTMDVSPPPRTSPGSEPTRR